MTTVTAVIPAYKAEALVERAVRSVQHQSVRVERIAVVDDWSPDGTREVVCRLAAEDPRVLDLQTPRNGGPGPARQVGVAAGEGTDLVAFLDADDEWHPEHLARAIAVLEARPDVVCTWASYEHRAVGAPWDSQPPPTVLGELDAWALVHGSLVVQSGAVARRAAVQAVDGFYPDVRWCEDYCLWIRLATRGPMAHISGATVRRHDHEAQISRQFGKMSAGRWQALARFARWAPARWPAWDPARFERLAQEAVDLDIAHARANRSDDWMEAVLREAAALPYCTERVAHWTDWRKRQWPLERSMLKVYDRLPEPMLALLRRLRPA